MQGYANISVIKSLENCETFAKLNFLSNFLIQFLTIINSSNSIIPFLTFGLL